MDRFSDRHTRYDDLSDSATGSTSAVKLSNGLHSKSMHETNGDGPEQSKSEEDVAVIGIAIKFPQDATSTESFWNMLMDRRSALTDVPKDRYNIDAFWSPDASEPGTVRPASLACVLC